MEQQMIGLAPVFRAKQPPVNQGLNLVWLLCIFLLALLFPSTSTAESSVLHAQLGLRNGRFCIDPRQTTFSPSPTFTQAFKGSHEKAKQALLKALDDALAQEASAVLTLATAELLADYPTNKAVFFPVLELTADWTNAAAIFSTWGETNNISEGEGYLPLLLSEFVSDPDLMHRMLAKTPFVGGEIDTMDQDVGDALCQGRVDFLVADPVSSSDFDGHAFSFGDNQGMFAKAKVTTAQLGRLLRPLKGELWNPYRIQGQLKDFFGDMGFQSSLTNIAAFSFDAIKIYRPSTGREVMLEGTPRLAGIQIVAPHANQRLVHELLYLILPQEDYKKVHAAPANYLINSTIGVGTPVEIVMLDYASAAGRILPHAAPYLNQQEFREKLAGLQSLGFQARMSEHPAPLPAFPSDKLWADLVLFPVEGPATNVVTQNLTLGPPIQGKERNHLQVAAGIESKQPFTVLAEYTRESLITNDTFNVRAGWRNEPLFGGSYQRDFAGFDGLNRRFSFSLAGNSDFHVDRVMNFRRFDERRDSGTASAQLELFRDRNGQWLRLETDVSHAQVETIQGSSKSTDDISRANIGMSYSCLRNGIIHAGGLEITPRLSIARSDRHSTVFVQPSLRTAYHRNLWQFYEVDSRASIDWASAGTPTTELPRFGGEDSVRGFRLEAGAGRLSWAVQNEFWIPLRFTDHFGKIIGPILRPNLKLGAFVDIGGLDKAQQNISSFESGAGLGLRYIFQRQAALRLDWAHPLTGFSSDQGGHSVYFSVAVMPTHF